eukprot:TRINITY_DN42334_c0_g1_i1.p1 TRINITY_DN42334_c0_g1~~TRINITY_DN42334_c0_g1_i1.p1  ORF type:complete len:433 (-),score=64.10 TRINITY_DN42334_c0_g1_i1:154-1452(-)
MAYAHGPVLASFVVPPGRHRRVTLASHHHWHVRQVEHFQLKVLFSAAAQEMKSYSRSAADAWAMTAAVRARSTTPEMRSATPEQSATQTSPQRYFPEALDLGEPKPVEPESQSRSSTPELGEPQPRRGSRSIPVLPKTLRGLPPQRILQKSATSESLCSKKSRASRRNIAIIAPGAGTGHNGKVFDALSRSGRFKFEIIGQSRAVYDRYPESWPNGKSEPNLSSFAKEVLATDVTKRADCLLVGSRGGQVVLPEFWKAEGIAIPPTVVLNGGCAMSLPEGAAWPDTAVTFLLMGGQDHFRQHFSPAQYVANAKQHVPAANRTTAILFVNEMMHLPQGHLLAAVLPHMLMTSLAWHNSRSESEHPPLRELHELLTELNRLGCWSGRLLWTSSPGVWEDVPFGTQEAQVGHLLRRSRHGYRHTALAGVKTAEAQ